MPDVRSKQGCDLLLDSCFTSRRTSFHCIYIKNKFNCFRRNAVYAVGCEDILEHVVNLELDVIFGRILV